jgi:hypothetical protein
VMACDLAGYQVYRGLSSGGPYARVTVSPTPASTYRDTSVTEGIVYYYAVSAVDSKGNEGALSTEASATPLDRTPPSVPVGLTALVGDGEVTLQWSANAESDLAGYRLYRSATFGGPYGLPIDAPIANRSLDSGLTNFMTYYYAVSAVDQDGNESARSSDVSATPVSTFRRGDWNQDKGIDLSDPIGILTLLFASGEDFGCLDSGDVNDDGELDISDPVMLLLWLFASGVDLAAPGPYACGPDPTPDGLRECRAGCR